MGSPGFPPKSSELTASVLSERSDVTLTRPSGPTTYGSADWWLRSGRRVDGFLYDKAHNPYSGAIAMAVGMVVSIWLFSNQTKYVGPAPSHWKSLGDITFEVGFVVSALIYIVLFRFQKDRYQSEVAVIS